MISSTSAANGTTTITVYPSAIATREKNNADLPLLVGNITICGTLADALCTNCNVAAWPSDLGLALGSLYIHCSPTSALSIPLTLVRSLLAGRLVNC
jgi:hypothetical protein